MSSQGFGVPPYIQSNNVSSQYSLNGELPPQIAVKEQALSRRQQIANLMLQNSMKPLQGGMAGRRFYVPPSWTQGMAQLAEALGGVVINRGVDKDRASLADENQRYTTDAIQQYQQKMAGTPEQPGQPMEMPAQGPGAPDIASVLASRNGPGDQGTSGKMPDLSAPVAIEGPQPTNTVTGPPTPAVPATPQDKQAAMMELLAKRIPGAQTILAMQQHQEQLDAANQDRKDNRAFLAAQNDENRQVRREGNEQNAALRVEQMRTNTNMLQMQIEERQARGQDTRELQQTLADQKSELSREQIKAEDLRAKRHDETMREIAKMNNATKETVADKKAGQKGQMPPAALKMQQEDLDTIGSMSSINADLKSFEQQIDSGALQLGPMNNLVGTARNAIGASNESSRNLASFKATMEKQRNASLLLNKGVQTEGDAQRAWNELFANINDKDVVKQRLQEIQKINERGSNLRKMNVDVIRQNYGLEPMDVSGYQNQSPAVGKGGAAKISSDADYDKLPSGATFIAPDGTTRKKP